MDGMHDLGGKQGFGRVRHSRDAGVFHAEWEKRGNALLALAVKSGFLNMDEYRHAIERMEPRHYLSAGYYERAFTGLLTLLVEKGIVAREELERLAGGAIPLSLPSAPGRSNAPSREAFARGDRVRVNEEFIPGHIRMPAYIRGKTGVVVDISPAYPFPDAHAHGIHAEDEPTYAVEFRSQDLWQQGADAALVHVDVFQSYLQRA
jgi:nitrile hydratase subunit beta